VKKHIAAALLVAMVGWAEMAVAPMLLMHAGHMHAALEMAEHKGAHQHVMPAGHPCCPGLGKTGEMAALEIAAASLPCQDQHRCCFLQGPQSVPATVGARRGLSREIAAAEIAELSPAHEAESHVSVAAAAASGPPPGLLGMVLRV